jgi:cation:H+ antiporter
MPEVFTSLFFLFVLMDGEGFSGGIGTTAGSAIFNGMVIPAVSVLAVIGMGMVKKIEVSRKVLMRDGIALIIAELIFLILISGSVLDWYHGVLLMGVYAAYIIFMFATMKKSEKKESEDGHLSEEDFIDEERKNTPFFKALITFDLERVFLGTKIINKVKAWALLIFSTVSIALVCYFLVLACEWIGAETYTIANIGTFNGLGIPIMFVALILASAASSFPDTIISMKDAKRGQYDDAISNALGSNIFDICFALGFPLFIFTMLNGPLHMPPEIVDLSSELRFLLWLLTVLAVVIFTWGKYFGKAKAFVLLTIYFLFVLYVVARGAENSFAQAIADFLVSVVKVFTFQI